MPESTVNTEATTTPESAKPVPTPTALFESIVPRLEIRQSFQGEYTAACPFCRVGEIYVSSERGFLCLNEQCRREGSLEKLAYMLDALPRSDEVGEDAADLGWPEPPDKEAFWGLVFGKSLGDPLADNLLEELREHPEGMTRTEIRDFFGRNKSSEKVSSALGLLLRQGHVERREREGGQHGGRSTEVWFPARGATT
jgi:hypothetical protein